MCNCSCGSEEKKNALLPQVGIITDIRRETPDVKTFRIVRPDGTKLFEHMPGQCAMLCVPGVGEALFSITSSPTNKEYQEFSIKECGTLTNYLHNMSVGDEILVRGPYGNHFPVETVLKGQDLLFIADTPMHLEPLEAVDFRKGQGMYSHAAFNSSYAALYYPWLEISDPVNSRKKLVPLCGQQIDAPTYPT